MTEHLSSNHAINNVRRARESCVSDEGGDEGGDEGCALVTDASSTCYASDSSLTATCVYTYKPIRERETRER